MKILARLMFIQLILTGCTPSGCTPYIKNEIIDLSSALLTPVIALLGIYIAIQQYKINKTRLKHELFDKKFIIFEATKKFLSAIITDFSVKDEDRREFLRDTKGALFLFEPNIVEYLDKIYKNALKLKLHETKGEDDKSFELEVWFSKQIEEIDKKFENSMKINF